MREVEFPESEFFSPFRCCGNKLELRLTILLISFSSQEFTLGLELQNCRNTSLRFRVSIINLLAFSVFNSPVLNLTAFSSNKQVVAIDLVKFGWLIVQFQSLEYIFSPSFQIDNGNIHNLIIKVRKAEDSCRALNYWLIQVLEFDHLISVGGTSVAFFFFDSDNYYRFLLNNWISIIVHFFLFFFLFGWRFFLLFFIFLLNFLLSWHRHLIITSEGIGLVAHVFCGINIIDSEYLIRVRICRPNTKVAVSASCGKVLILQFIQSYNLCNFNIMGTLDNIVLILLLKTKHHEITFSK